MEENKKSFKSSYGLDAGGHLVTSVKTPSKDSMTDGTNVQFFIDNNTIQLYDESRGYDKGFAVIHNNKIYVSKSEVKKPAGKFNLIYWQALSSTHDFITVGTTSTPVVLSANAYAYDSKANGPIKMQLPENPTPGMSIVMVDIGGNTGLNRCSLSSKNHNIIVDGRRTTEYLLTVPYQASTAVFNNNSWTLFNNVGDVTSHKATKATLQVQANDIVYGDSSVNKYEVMLPIYANDGDVITLHDTMSKKGDYSIEVVTSSASENKASIQTPGTNKFKPYAATIKLVYDAQNSLWLYVDESDVTRVKLITSNTTLEEFTSVVVVGNTSIKNVVLTLPDSGSPGATIDINLMYQQYNQSTTIKVSDKHTGSGIVVDAQLLNFEQCSKRRAQELLGGTKSITIDNTFYRPRIQLFWDTDCWKLSEFSNNVEAVDPSYPARLGVAALATQTEANSIDKSKAVSDKIITPKTLANRTATESRTGIAAIATQDVTNAGTDDITIVTPKKLNDRKASESLTGIAAIATQVVTDAGVDDTTIVTPKKLNDRKATTKLTGIARIATQTELVAGTLDNTIIVPKTLNDVRKHPTQWKATTVDNGFIRIARADDETYTGNGKPGSTLDPSTYNEITAVSPKGLNTALANYLLKEGKAVDSTLFDGNTTAAFTMKAKNEVVTGKWQFSNQQSFNDVIVVSGGVSSKQSSINNLHINGATDTSKGVPSLIVGGSGVVGSEGVIEFKTGQHTLSSNSWVIRSELDKAGGSTSLKISSMSGDDQKVYKDLLSFDLKGSIDFNKNTATNLDVLNLNKSLDINSQTVLSTADANKTVVLSNSKATKVDVKVADANSMYVTDGSGSYQVMTRKNLTENIGDDFLSTKGGTVNGHVTINNNSIEATMPESTALETKINKNIGVYNVLVKTKEVYEKLPPKKASRRVELGGNTAYYDQEYGPGTLTNITSSATAGYQLWAPNDSIRKYMRVADNDGTYKDWAEIITTENLPSAEELGAVSASDLIFKWLKVAEFIQVGNVRLIPNPKTKSLDIVWVENL